MDYPTIRFMQWKDRSPDDENPLVGVVTNPKRTRIEVVTVYDSGTTDVELWDSIEEVEDEYIDAQDCDLELVGLILTACNMEES